jgi:hypothetical protein
MCISKQSTINPKIKLWRVRTMEKTLFEQMGGTYTRTGDYYLPALDLPAEKERHIGV